MQPGSREPCVGFWIEYMHFHGSADGDKHASIVQDLCVNFFTPIPMRMWRGLPCVETGRVQLSSQVSSANHENAVVCKEHRLGANAPRYGWRCIRPPLHIRIED